MGVVSVTTFATDTETVTKTKLNGLAANLVTEFNGSIDNANIKAAAAIVASKLDLTTAAAIGSTAPSTGAFTTLSATGAFTLPNTATTADIAAITGNSLTTGKGLSITSTSTARTADNLLHVVHTGDSAAENLGSIAYFESDDNDVGVRDVVGIKNTDALAVGATCLGIDQVSTNAGIDVNCTGNGPHLRMIGDPTVASPTDGDLWYTGSALNFRNGAATVDLLSGTLVQMVNVQTGAVAGPLETAIPKDDTIPQITEGVEVMTLAITPTSATNKLKIDVVVNAGCDTSDKTITAALFQDTTAGALAASSFMSPSSAACTDGIVFTYYMEAGTAAETTFRVRLGANDTTDVTFNGSADARIFGGVMASSITITEIKV